jgi:hypothetical protein
MLLHVCVYIPKIDLIFIIPSLRCKGWKEREKQSISFSPNPTNTLGQHLPSSYLYPLLASKHLPPIPSSHCKILLLDRLPDWYKHCLFLSSIVG